MRTVATAVLAVLLLAGPRPSPAAPEFREEAKLDAAADAKKSDFFGFSVGVSGTTMIVGAQSDDVQMLRPGSAYVFVRSGTTWTRQQRLVADDAADRDLFGSAVAIDGSTAIVGARRSTSGFGAAYVFVRNGTTWTQQQKLEAPVQVAGDICGYAVDVSGDTAVMTCHNLMGGAAYVFHRSGGTWTLQGTLLPVNPANGGAGDYFGFSVAIDGDTVAVGAITDADRKGVAAVYVRNGTTWSFQQKCIADDGIVFDRLGWSVALSGNTVIAGQHHGNTSQQPLRQAAYVFVRNGATWTQQQKLVAANAAANDKFGGSVAVSGDVALVGASGDDTTVVANGNEGSARLFTRANGAWSPGPTLTASDQDAESLAGKAFGFAVGLSGTTAVVGAPDFSVGTNVYLGHAYTFVNPDTDGDALPDEWETNGVTIDGVHVDLPAMGANPRHKDLFVHGDWMAAGPGDPSGIFKPSARAIKIVADAFAQAPVTNPDGRSGISLHVDLGPTSVMNPRTGATWGGLSRAGEVPYQAVVGTLNGMGELVWTGVDTIKGTHFGPAKRATVFRYALFGDSYAGANGRSGIARAVPSLDFLVTFGGWSPRGGTPLPQAGTFMHELGHTLGLEHGGGDEVNRKPNYLSVMNYSFQLKGVLRTATQRRYDYSRHALAALDETSLDETVGIADPDHALTLWNIYTRPVNPVGSNKCFEETDVYFTRFLPAPALDWDCDGVPDGSPVAADVNRDGLCVDSGPDGIGDTAINGPVGDDEVRDRDIWAGPNRTCETAKAGDDVQVEAVGYVEPGPSLAGFDDWSNLDFTGGGGIGSRSGVAPPPESTVIAEPTMAELVLDVPPALLAEEASAPLDVVTLSTQEGTAPLVVQFDGSGSTAVGGAIATWTWDFGDGATGSGATTQHLYATPGEYFASLTVTDGAGRVNLVPLTYLVTVTDGAAPTPTPTATPGGPLGLDAFLLYATVPNAGAPKFAKVGPVTLADAFASGAYDVQKPTALGVPANVGGGVVDAATHLAAYAVKPAKGASKPGPRANVRVASACGEAVVTTGKPVTLLVPSALGLDAPVPAPDEGDHEVDHFVCYQAKAQKKDAAGAPVAPLPKGAQVDAVGALDTKRYDLKKLVALCHPSAKSGAPTVLAGPAKGTAFPLTPATVRHPGSHLLCYAVAATKKRIEQNGCGPAVAGDKGVAIAQAKHAPRVGAHVADQLGARRIDTKKEGLLCLPATVAGP